MLSFVIDSAVELGDEGGLVVSDFGVVDDGTVLALHLFYHFRQLGVLVQSLTLLLPEARFHERESLHDAVDDGLGDREAVVVLVAIVARIGVVAGNWAHELPARHHALQGQDLGRQRRHFGAAVESADVVSGLHFSIFWILSNANNYNKGLPTAGHEFNTNQCSI